MDDYLKKKVLKDLFSPLICPLLVPNFNVLLICSSENLTSLVA